MKKVILSFSALILLSPVCSVAAADPIMASQYCSRADIEEVSAAHEEMLNSVVFERLQTQVGSTLGLDYGDCKEAYSLERSAGRTHPADAPRPFCGLKLILDPEREKEQAAAVLDSFSKRFISSTGQVFRLCSIVGIN